MGSDCLQVLLQLRDYGGASVRGTTIFYFTDNSTTYWIAAGGSSKSPGLHSLLEEIRLIELELGCTLQVVHVPGVVMITQGTDGLSRGVWATALHDWVDQGSLTEAVFAPLPVDMDMASTLARSLGHDRFRYQPWESVWDARDMFDTMSIWFPPPEIARQAITFMLEAWVERPGTTSALFFVPRVIPAFWHGLSRHIQELPMIHPFAATGGLRHPSRLPIPVIVLYLPPYVHVLPPPRHPRMGLPAQTGEVRWHEEQAARMRGLPPRGLDS